jgi:hypothetical protein
MTRAQSWRLVLCETARAPARTRQPIRRQPRTRENMGSAPSAAQRATRTGRRLRQGREECRVAASRGLRVGAGGKLSASPWRSQTRPVQQAAHLRTQGPRRARHQTPRPCKRALGRGSLNVIAPSKARRLLPGESPGRVRASHPPVSSVGPVAERRKSRTESRASVHRESCRP